MIIDDNDDVQASEIDDVDLDETLGNQNEPSNDDQNPADELGFSFDDGDNEDEPEWAKELRRENREMKRLLQERDLQNGNLVLRERPTLHDFDYDSEAYEEDLEQWYQEKAQYDEMLKAEQSKHQVYDERYVSSVKALQAATTDYADVEGVVIDNLSVTKQAMIKLVIDDPAKMVYALGKSPKKLAELAELDDAQFIKQIVLMEQQMTTKNRNPNKPQPKQHELTGSAGGADSKLAKLEAEALKTGDRSAVLAYKRQLKRK